MRLALAKRAVVQVITTFVVAAAAFIGYSGITTDRARSKAEEVCRIVPAGANASAVEEVVAGSRIEPELHSQTERQISYGFHGAFLERWFCNVSLSEGKVVGQEVHLVD